MRCIVCLIPITTIYPAGWWGREWASLLKKSARWGGGTPHGTAASRGDRMDRREYAAPRRMSRHRLTTKDPPPMDAPRVARLGQPPTFSRRRALHAAGGGLSTLAGLGLRHSSAMTQSGTPIAATGQPASE